MGEFLHKLETEDELSIAAEFFVVAARSHLVKAVPRPDSDETWGFFEDRDSGMIHVAVNCHYGDPGKCYLGVFASIADLDKV